MVGGDCSGGNGTVVVVGVVMVLWFPYSMILNRL